MPAPRILSAVAVCAGLTLAACGGDDAGTEAPVSSSTTSVEVNPSETQSTLTVDANTASEDEIIAALEAAGVANAAQWADEITEYRPYPADDPEFSKLRDELEKYNPADGVIDSIISVLTL